MLEEIRRLCYLCIKGLQENEARARGCRERRNQKQKKFKEGIWLRDPKVDDIKKNIKDSRSTGKELHCWATLRQALVSLLIRVLKGHLSYYILI